MPKKDLPIVTATLEKIVGGGQAMGTMEDGRKLFVWGGLPGETVEVQLTKKKTKLAEGYVTSVIKASKERVEPHDPESFLSTSPWQIMSLATEQTYKSALIKEAFDLHNVTLPNEVTLFTDGQEYEYRNKVEFSFWVDADTRQLDLAFFRRGTHGKIPIEGTSLAHPAINAAGQAIRDLLIKKGISGFDLKTLLIRCDAEGNVVAQLYVKTEEFRRPSDQDLKALPIKGFELIFSNPKSPASVITKTLFSWGDIVLSDTILNIPFTYATEGFFQINLPVYTQALKDMKQWIPAEKSVVDLYSGVGSIGLTIGGNKVTLVELNESAVREMKENITALKRNSEATAVLAASEKALEYITSKDTIIVDPPRAGLHQDVVERLLSELPERIIYLSCNPVTQARDIMLLGEHYEIKAHQGYNFFPRTPHIENLVILDKK
ncbi:MAG: putative methyltransferase [Candidatus Saccharibacteria bacterium]|nr:putative methyltransferase [Candidatus Saccharibacteria bacterium]